MNNATVRKGLAITAVLMGSFGLVGCSALGVEQEQEQEQEVAQEAGAQPTQEAAAPTQEAAAPGQGMEIEPAMLVGLWAAEKGLEAQVAPDGRCQGLYFHQGQQLDIGGPMTCQLGSKQDSEGGYKLQVTQQPNQIRVKCQKLCFYFGVCLVMTRESRGG